MQPLVLLQCLKDGIILPAPVNYQTISLRSVFESALQLKDETEGTKENTISSYRSLSKKLIPDDLADADIRAITSNDIKKFLQSYTSENHPTKKQLYKCKSLLNLIFRYACDPETFIICINPVPKGNSLYMNNLTPVEKDPLKKAFQPEEIKRIREYLWNRISETVYDVNGYAMILSSYTGMREGEIPSLKWSDISENEIHIHSQQNSRINSETGKKEFYYNDSTKNEKGYSRGGRFFPITRDIRKVLDCLKAKQEELGIHSEWVFAKMNGEWITTVSYYEALYRLSSKLELTLSNNHAFRIALNSYVFIPLGIPATERARMLGHSVETNLSNYSYSMPGANDKIRKMLDGFEEG